VTHETAQHNDVGDMQTMADFLKMKDEDEQRKWFYSQCLTIKLACNDKNRARKVLISDLYTLVKEENIPLEGWHSWIQNHLKMSDVPAAETTMSTSYPNRSNAVGSRSMSVGTDSMRPSTRDYLREESRTQLLNKDTSNPFRRPMYGHSYSEFSTSGSDRYSTEAGDHTTPSTSNYGTNYDPQAYQLGPGQYQKMGSPTHTQSSFKFNASNAAQPEGDMNVQRLQRVLVGKATPPPGGNIANAATRVFPRYVPGSQGAFPSGPGSQPYNFNLQR